MTPKQAAKLYYEIAISHEKEKAVLKLEQVIRDELFDAVNVIYRNAYNELHNAFHESALAVKSSLKDRSNFS